MRLTSPRPADLHISQPPAAEKPLIPIEPISPLSLGSHQAAIGVNIHNGISTRWNSLDQFGQRAIHGLNNFRAKENTVGNSDRQDRLPQGGRLLNNDFLHSDLPRRISEAIQTVIRDQQKVSGMRVQLAELRSDLDKKRTAQIYQWADTLQRIKSTLSSASLEKTKPDAVTLQARSLETINQQSDDYLLRENEYQNFQRQLEVEENSLQQKQAHVAEMLQGFSRKDHATELDMTLPCRDVDQGTQDMWAMSENDSNTAGTINAPMELHPLVEKYLSEIGEVRMYQERLGELLLEHAEVTGREASLALVNLSLDEGSRYFLDNFESQRLELEEIISRGMSTAASIREQCEKEGLSLPTNLQWGVETELDIDIKEGLPQDRDLLWRSELDEPFNFIEQAQARDFNIYKFIDGWILHHLRHSTSQIYRYKSNPRLQELNMDGDELSDWVMKLWFRDDVSKSLPFGDISREQ